MNKKLVIQAGDLLEVHGHIYQVYVCEDTNACFDERGKLIYDDHVDAWGSDIYYDTVDDALEHNIISKVFRKQGHDYLLVSEVKTNE